MTVWFITGTSRGLGMEITRAALAHGDRVVATARTPAVVHRALPGAERLLVLPLDVTDEPACRSAVARAVAEYGRIDVLVNNAAWGLMGAVEETSDAEARALFDTNLFGLLNVLRAALPQLRAQRWGHIINIGSIGGFTQNAGVGVYGATKFAVEGITEALNAEINCLGLRATVVEPGVFRTDFLDSSSLRHAALTIDDYDPTAGARRRWALGINGRQPGDPAKAARAIVAMAHSPEPPTRLQLGADSVSRVEAKLDHVRAELDAWREVAMATAHDDQDAGWSTGTSAETGAGTSAGTSAETGAETGAETSAETSAGTGAGTSAGTGATVRGM